MRMYELSIPFLAEDDVHARFIHARITELLARERMVLAVENLEDVTKHATDENELTEEEVDEFLRGRDTFFLNRVNRDAHLNGLNHA